MRTAILFVLFTLSAAGQSVWYDTTGAVFEVTEWRPGVHKIQVRVIAPSGRFLGIEDSTVSDTSNLISTQRVAKYGCPTCGREDGQWYYSPDGGIYVNRWFLHAADAEKWKKTRLNVCSECGTTYAGRRRK